MSFIHGKILCAQKGGTEDRIARKDIDMAVDQIIGFNMISWSQGPMTEVVMVACHRSQGTHSRGVSGAEQMLPDWAVVCP